MWGSAIERQQTLDPNPERNAGSLQPDNQDETSATIWMRAGRLARNAERA